MQRGFLQTSSARRSRDPPLLPSMAASQGDRGLLAGAQRPADGPAELVPVPRCEPVQLLDQLVARADPVAGHHQPASQRRRQGLERLAEQPQVIGGRVAAGRVRPKHPGQWLARVIAGREQWMMPVAFKVRLCQFLVAVRLDDGGVQADADDALKDPVRDPGPAASARPAPTRAAAPCSPRRRPCGGHGPLRPRLPSAPDTQSGPTQPGRTAPAGRPSPGNR